jgi:hypothetical protein
MISQVVKEAKAEESQRGRGQEDLNIPARHFDSITKTKMNTFGILIMNKASDTNMDGI